MTNADTHQQGPIEIIDVIHHYANHCGKPLAQVFVVISRRPEFIYEKRGTNLVAHDSGFYDHMYIEQPWGGFQAFAGREFDIKLTDGSTLHCNGQVWSGRKVEAAEPMIHVGCATIEELEKCYVFAGAEISKTKYDAWMAVNKPSHNYDKYDPRSTIAYIEDIYRKHPGGDRPVSAQRARKLRQRGVTIRRHPETGRLGWSPRFEARKAEILRKSAPDYKARFHPDNFNTGA